MSIWLFRAGSAGEFEDEFLTDNRVYLTWNDLNVDLNSFEDQTDLKDFLIEHYELLKAKIVVNWASQIYPIVAKIQMGDWVVLSSKKKPYHSFRKNHRGLCL